MTCFSVKHDWLVGVPVGDVYNHFFWEAIHYKTNPFNRLLVVNLRKYHVIYMYIYIASIYFLHKQTNIRYDRYWISSSIWLHIHLVESIKHNPCVLTFVACSPPGVFPVVQVMGMCRTVRDVEILIQQPWLESKVTPNKPSKVIRSNHGTLSWL